MKISAIAVALIAGTAMGQVELATNGDFETGDTSGWTSIPTGNSLFEAQSSDVFAGGFSGRVENLATGSAHVIKQANVGVGQVDAGEIVTYSFWAKSNQGVGGVSFIEVFSELAGGGTSASELVGTVAADGQWAFYSFDVAAGPDVSGGVTLQFTATTGAVIGSTSELFVDDVSITIVPTPGAFAALGMGGLVMARRRR
jgi:hypothetical protein